MFGSSYKVATILGIPIKLHISVLLMVFIMVHQFGLLSGVLIELGLIISIILHELGHSVIAILKGCRVREITLMLIGGVAKMERIPEKPFDEFMMALAGPAVSLVLGVAGVFFGHKMIFLPEVNKLGVNV
ncbi:MAG: M50 family metallopeptidase, partial [Kiritimatiellae bacterium]|nr:M50 family metallopeptidase [Kiritimatiellia bacterium]